MEPTPLLDPNAEQWLLVNTYLPILDLVYGKVLPTDTILESLSVEFNLGPVLGQRGPCQSSSLRLPNLAFTLSFNNLVRY